MAGAQIALDQIRWLKDGVIYMVRPLEIDGYAPDHITYVSQGVSYSQSISAEHGVPIMIPKDAVDAVIFYKEVPEEPGMDEETDDEPGDAINEDDEFATFFNDDMPLAGVMMKNSGLCID